MGQNAISDSISRKNALFVIQTTFFQPPNAAKSFKTMVQHFIPDERKQNIVPETWGDRLSDNYFYTFCPNAPSHNKFWG